MSGIRKIIMMAANLVFVYNTISDTCSLQQGELVKELTIKGATQYNGVVNGTWFQVNHSINHWISFRPSRFYSDTYEAFYKSVNNDEIRYYRRLLRLENSNLLLVYFTEKDEWVKVNGKWQSRYR